MYRVPGKSETFSIAWHCYRGISDIRGYVKNVEPQKLSNVASKHTLNEAKGQRLLRRILQEGKICRPLLVLKTDGKYKWKILDGRNILEVELVRKNEN